MSPGESADNNVDIPPRLKRRLSPSLLTFFAVITVVGVVGFFWFGARIHSRNLVVREVERVKGQMTRVWRGPAWLRPMAGDPWVASAFAEIREVRLRGMHVTDDVLKAIVATDTIERLDLNETKVSDTGLGQLESLPNLRALSVAGSSVTDAGISRLVQFVNLIELKLDDTQVTDAGLAHLAKLRELRDLSLNGTSVTDAGLQNLKSLPELERLSLDATLVSDAGLPILWSLPNLQSLSLNGTNVTEGGRERLKNLTSSHNFVLTDSESFAFTLHWKANPIYDAFVSFNSRSVPSVWPHGSVFFPRTAVDGQDFNGCIFYRRQPGQQRGENGEPVCQLYLRRTDSRTIVIRLENAVRVRIMSDDNENAALTRDDGKPIAWGASLAPGQHRLTALLAD